MATSTSSVIGVNLTRQDSTAQFPVGTRVNLDNGGTAVYVQALSTLSQYRACAIYANNTAVMLDTTVAGTTKRVAYSQVSITSAYYGWLHEGGRVVCGIAAACAQNALLFTTGTPGVLDDATISNALMAGVVLDTSLAVASISAATDATINVGANFVSFFSNPA